MNPDEDLSGWIECYGLCGGYIWRTHKPSEASFTSFEILKSCDVCEYRARVDTYVGQYHVDLFNKITVGNKWVRDDEDNSVERVSRTTEWLFKMLDVESALELYKEVFEVHIDKIAKIWARNLRLELSNRPR
jgi:hypothetical protein